MSIVFCVCNLFFASVSYIPRLGSPQSQLTNTQRYDVPCDAIAPVL